LVINKRLTSILVKNEWLWIALLHKLRGDCVLCWHEGKDFRQWVGCAARDELRMRISHIRLRKEWSVKFSSRVFFQNAADGSALTSNHVLLHPQKKPIEVVHKKPTYKLSRVVPLAPSAGEKEEQPAISATESSMAALLDTFLLLEFPSLIIGGKRERKHFHCSQRSASERQHMFKIKASGWYREKVRSSTEYESCTKSTCSLERQVARDLSDAVGGHGNPTGIYWHSIALRSFRTYTHYLLHQIDDDDGSPEYGPLRQLLVAVKLYRGMKDGKVAVCARVAGAIVLPSRLICRCYTWVDRITDIEDDGDDDSEGVMG
jgi:hypothetical protein